MTIKKIMIVDDEKSARVSLALALRSPAYETILAKNGKEAIELLQSSSFDLLITDYEMPQMDGLRLVKAIKEIYPSLPILVVSGEAPVRELIDAGASGFLQKPFGLSKIRDLVYSQLFKTNDSKAKPLN